MSTEFCAQSYDCIKSCNFCKSQCSNSFALLAYHTHCCILHVQITVARKSLNPWKSSQLHTFYMSRRLALALIFHLSRAAFQAVELHVCSIHALASYLEGCSAKCANQHPHLQVMRLSCLFRFSQLMTQCTC